MSHPELSPRAREVDQEIRGVREALLRFGTDMQMLDRATADHDRRPPAAPHPDLSMETITVGRLMDVVLREWDPEELPEDPSIGSMELRRITRLRQTILDFGFAFDLFSCDCDEEFCPTRNPHALDTRDLLSVVERQWHERSGCRGHCETPLDPDKVAKIDLVLERNIHLVSILARRLVSEAAVSNWEPVLERYAHLVNTAAHAEMRKQAMHSLDVWARGGKHGFLEVDHAHRALQQIPIQGGWGQRETAAFTLAVNDAIDAILLRDIVRPEVFDLLYEALNPAIPFNEVNVALASEIRAQ